MERQANSFLLQGLCGVCVIFLDAFTRIVPDVFHHMRRRDDMGDAHFLQTAGQAGRIVDRFGAVINSGQKMRMEIQVIIRNQVFEKRFSV